MVLASIVGARQAVGKLRSSLSSVGRRYRLHRAPVKRVDQRVARAGARQGLHCQGGRRYLGDRSLWTPDALVCTLRGLSAWARTLPPYAPSSTPAWARWLASWGESCIPRACPEAPSSRSWKTLPVP